MTNEEIMELIKESPATQMQVHLLTKMVYVLDYIIRKEIKPSDELTKEAFKYAEDVIQAQLSELVENYKKQYEDEIGLYDKLGKLFK